MKFLEVPSKKSSDVLLIIPAYNEAGCIERTVDEIREHYPEFDYVVVLDGPTDGTDLICRRRGYNALYLPENLGLTGCFRQGMIYASEYGYRYAVQFDGDGQHRPEYIELMRQKADEGYDIVLGSRFLEKGGKGQITLMRGIGSRLIMMMIRMKTGQLITDPTCGLRLYSARVITAFAGAGTLPPEPDTIAAFMLHGARVAEVPVRVAERDSGKSYLSPLRAVKYMMRMLISIYRLG